MSQFLSLSFSLFLTFSILLFLPRSFLLCFSQISVIYHRLAGVFNLFSCPHVALKSMQCHIFLDWWFPILDSHVTWNTQILKMSNPWWWWFSCSVESNSCNPMDCSLPGFSVHGLLQARILEWVAIPFSRGSSQPRDGTWVSCIAAGFKSLKSLNYLIQLSIICTTILIKGLKTCMY